MESQQQQQQNDSITQKETSENFSCNNNDDDKRPTLCIDPESEITILSPKKSPLSSPSHEFSFTISLHSNATTTSSSPTLTPKSKHHQKTPSAIELTPADDIFFHGHLLPLHFLSHLHASSPRSSTNSHDSFALPKHEQKPVINSLDRPVEGNFGSSKSKPFSLFGFAKWLKGSETTQTKEKAEKKKETYSKFDVSNFLKRYVKMVKPMLSSRGGRTEKVRVQGHQSYSFSESLSPRINKSEHRSLRGGFSAPCSMRTSPTNSGRLLATAGVPSLVSDSTMEELQNAIQAAIAHCKNSTNTNSTKGKSKELSSPVPVN